MDAVDVIRNSELKLLTCYSRGSQPSGSLCCGREMFAIGMHISPYEQGNIYNRDPMRPKKLLLHRAQIIRLGGLVQRQGYALIPLKIYLKDGRMKMELGVCKGKKLHDKRDTAAERTAQRDIERAMKQ